MGPGNKRRRREGAPEDWPGSNLPLVFLEMAGKAIPDEPKIPARKAELLTVPQERNFERWPILGLRVWPNPDPVPKTWEVEISRLRDWITARAAWMDRELSGF